jgi:putative acetyltransferase
MNYTICPAEEKHYKEMHNAMDIVACERKYLAFTQAPALEQSVAFYRSLASAGFPHFLAVDGDQVLGWVDVSPQFGESRSHIGVLGIGLIPRVRYQGIGARLMQAAIEKAWSKGLTRIELTVRSDNMGAKALYEKFGFQTEGTLRRGFRIDGEYFDAHIMALLR